MTKFTQRMKDGPILFIRLRVFFWSAYLLFGLVLYPLSLFLLILIPGFPWKVPIPCDAQFLSTHSLSQSYASRASSPLNPFSSDGLSTFFRLCTYGTLPFVLS